MPEMKGLYPSREGAGMEKYEGFHWPTWPFRAVWRLVTGIREITGR